MCVSVNPREVEGEGEIEIVSDVKGGNRLSERVNLFVRESPTKT